MQNVVRHQLQETDGVIVAIKAQLNTQRAVISQLRNRMEIVEDAVFKLSDVNQVY